MLGSLVRCDIEGLLYLLPSALSKRWFWSSCVGPGTACNGINYWGSIIEFYCWRWRWYLVLESHPWIWCIMRRLVGKLWSCLGQYGLWFGVLNFPLLCLWMITGLNWRSQQDGSGRGWCVTRGGLTVRYVAKGCNFLEFGIRLSSGHISEGTHKRVETVENAVLWGYLRGSGGLVA